MPKKTTTNLNQALSSLFEEMETRIVAAVDSHQAEIAGQIEELQQALDNIQLSTKTTAKKTSRPQVRESKKPTTGGKKKAKKKSKGGRARKADVKAAAVKALKAEGKPTGMTVLREVTPYNDNQLRRALADLGDEGVVKRDGERRDTVYWLSGAAAPSKPKAPRKPAKKKPAKKKTAKKKTAKKKSAKKKSAKK